MIAVYAPDAYFVTISDLPSDSTLEERTRILLEKLSEPFISDAQSIDILATCGISGYPEHGKTPEELIYYACLAKDLVENSRTACFQVYNPEIQASLTRKNAIIRAIPESLADGEFLLYYQPQVDIAANRIIGAEALIRWHNPQLGAVAPNEFIPLMEQYGLIELLGKFVIRESVEFLKTHGEKLHTVCESFRLAINLTTGELADPSVVEMIANELHSKNVDPKLLMVEITERTAMEDFLKSGRILHELRHMGVSIAIDDFGTGFSSLNYILQLAMDKIKRLFAKSSG